MQCVEERELQGSSHNSVKQKLRVMKALLYHYTGQSWTFLGCVRKLWYMKWVASGENGLTPAESIKRPPVETVCEWTLAAWDMVFANIVEHSFRKMGFPNALYETEDDATWNDANDNSRRW